MDGDASVVCSPVCPPRERSARRRRVRERWGLEITHPSSPALLLRFKCSLVPRGEERFRESAVRPTLTDLSRNLKPSALGEGRSLGKRFTGITKIRPGFKSCVSRRTKPKSGKGGRAILYFRIDKRYRDENKNFCYHRSTDCARSADAAGG